MQTTVNDVVMVHVSSLKRTAGTSSNFFVTFTDRIRRIKKLEFYNICIPYTWYDFNDGNLSICDIGGHLISIPAGTYTFTTLKAAIESAAVLAGTSTTVTLGDDYIISIAGATVDQSIHKGALTLGNLTIPIRTNEFAFRGPNRSFTITIDGVDLTVNVTAGNYTNYSLAQELQTQLTNLGGWTSLTVSYNKVSDLFNLAGVRTVAFTSATISISKSSIAQNIGLKADINIGAGDSINTNFHTSPILHTRYLTIRSNEIARLAYGPHPYKHYCVKIIVDEPPFFYVNFDIPTPHQIDATKGINIQTMDFLLLDQDGVLIDLNGFDWSMGLIIHN